MELDSQHATEQPFGLADWGLSPEKVDEAVRRIVESLNPLRIIAFGSWARGETHPRSDLDLAIFLDDASDKQAARHLYTTLSGIRLSFDLLTFPLEQHEKFRHSINSVHHDIDQDGVLLYERSSHGRASRTDAA